MSGRPQVRAIAAGALLAAAVGLVAWAALRGAEPELVDLFLGNMSSRAADDIRDEMEIMGAIPRGEVESAQEEVVQTALNLAEEGTLRLPIGGGDDMV